MADRKAVRPDWKISTIPKDASNATDPIVASNKEIEAVIANPSSLKPNTPLESDEVAQKPTEIDTPPRFNANLPYTPQPTIYSMNDQILMRAFLIIDVKPVFHISPCFSWYSSIILLISSARSWNIGVILDRTASVIFSSPNS